MKKAKQTNLFYQILFCPHLFDANLVKHFTISRPTASVTTSRQAIASLQHHHHHHHPINRHTRHCTNNCFLSRIYFHIFFFVPNDAIQTKMGTEKWEGEKRRRIERNDCHDFLKLNREHLCSGGQLPRDKIWNAFSLPRSCAAAGLVCHFSPVCPISLACPYSLAAAFYNNPIFVRSSCCNYFLLRFGFPSRRTCPLNSPV